MADLPEASFKFQMGRREITDLTLDFNNHRSKGKIKKEAEG